MDADCTENSSKSERVLKGVGKKMEVCRTRKLFRRQERNRGKKKEEEEMGRGRRNNEDGGFGSQEN